MDEIAGSTWESQLAAELDSPRLAVPLQGLSEAGTFDPSSAAADFAARARAGYRERTPPTEAALDLIELSKLSKDDSVGGAGPGFGGAHRLVVRPATDPACSFRMRRFGDHGMELTSTLPILESFGLVVVESVPLRLGPAVVGGPEVHIDDIGLRTDAPHGPEATRFVPEIHGPRLVAALDALSRRETDVDSLNRLVTVAGLDWQQVSILRAYLRYRLQLGTAATWAELADPLAQYPDVARAFIGYFQARFDPTRVGPSPSDAAPTSAERALCAAQLDLVTELDQDRVLRVYLGLIDATVRTNYFRRDSDGPLRSTVVLKFDSQAVPDMPAPRPHVEAFVHSPRVEGVHLRAGMIARGGLRWSERPTDFRTEVLDLAFAQVKKNAIIVPTGAKGGFVVRTPGPVTPDAVRAAYEEFVTGLLHVTDNIVGGEVVPPFGVVAGDGPDPYLVVAADKGTATFSDLANSVSEGLGFWLGDAFASGGSRGYDHKAMGITAKGAWVAVRRHFRELGIDVQSDPVQVVGVGDMSGDVFGNGMLLSRSIRLIAAFDHRHIFLDPDPDPEAAFEERARLFALPRSSWDDYGRDVISEGGGVWPRQTKSIPISAAMRSRLGVEAESLGPPELVSAILAAPVDLLWFGGIGTYIKAPDEPDLDVADHANDAVRITSDAVRARVVAEGANLGVTQKARIRYSRRGGRINADFIDNAAGVTTSDREVNLKILLALAIDRGRLAESDRDAYLSRSEAEVANEVLRQVDHSVAALNRAASGSASSLDAYESLIDRLEATGRLDRAVEVIPTTDELEVRRAAGAGLIRPELAVILAYAKSDLESAIESASFVRDAVMADAVIPYFPTPIRESFEDLISDHRLYPQLAATDTAGEIVDQLGIVWGHETAEETGRRLDEVAGAFWAARRLTGADRLWVDLEGFSDGISAEAESELHSIASGAVAELARWYLGRPGAFDLAATVARDSELADELASLSSLTSASLAIGESADMVTLKALDVDGDVAVDFLSARRRAMVGPVGAVTRATGRPAGDVVDGYVRVHALAGTQDIMASIRAATLVSPPPERFSLWQARALIDEIGEWAKGALVAALSRPESKAQTAAEAVAAWADEHRSDIDGAAALIDAPRRPNSDPTAMASLVLRRLNRALGD